MFLMFELIIVYYNELFNPVLLLDQYCLGCLDMHYWQVGVIRYVHTTLLQVGYVFYGKHLKVKKLFRSEDSYLPFVLNHLIKFTIHFYYEFINPYYLFRNYLNPPLEKSKSNSNVVITSFQLFLTELPAHLLLLRFLVLSQNSLYFLRFI